ncbi:hypothetical protein EWI73_16135 [Salmonella bongori]|nr:hypothetical protein EWI73_16135 [Salmonella bongori]
MTQSLSTVARYIRDRQDKTFRMKKLTSLGLSSRYRVDVFEGAKTTKATLLQSYQCGYKKEIFPLYKSYDTVNGAEQVVDKRQSFLNKRFFLIYLFIPAVVVTVGLYYVFKFFDGSAFVPDKKDESEFKSEISGNSVSSSGVGLTQGYPVSQTLTNSSVSSTWRIGGRLVKDDLSYVVLVNINGRVRIELLNDFSFNGLYMSGFVDGEKVTVWSGSLSSSGTGG